MAMKDKAEAVSTAVLDDDVGLKPVAVEVESATAEDRAILSDTEREAIRADALKQFHENRKKKIRAKAVKEELRRLERQHGGSEPLGGGLDDMVTFTINLPDNADRIMVNQSIMHNGQKVTVPRHVFNSIAETIWRTQVADHNLTGKKRESFYRSMSPVVASSDGAHRSGAESPELAELVRVS